ncbi:GtrA family protein [Geodermatophilus sp. SYSU D00779]
MTTARPRLDPRKLVRELGAFGVVGGVCFVLELALFQLFYAVVGLGAVTAKLIATLAAMTAAYLGHRYWSFAHRARLGVTREYVTFAVINGVTLGIGLGIVALVRHGLQQEHSLVLQVANIASIGIGTVVRYLGYKRWVFPKKIDPAPVTPVY